MSNGIIFENNELSDLLSGGMLLHEAYFGKTKELLAAEQQLDKFRNKHMGKYVLNTRVNSDLDLLEFDRMMEKIFGFGCLTLQITNSDIGGAATLSIDTNIDYMFHSDNIIVNSNGYKFKPEFDYSCFLIINSGLIFNPDFSTSEIMGIILHEIGHNFESAIDKNDGVMLKIYTLTAYLINIIADKNPGQNAVITGVINNTKTKKFIAKTNKKLRNNNSIPICVYDVLKQTFDLIMVFAHNIEDLIQILSFGFIKGNSFAHIYKFIKYPVFGFLNLKSGYTKEQIADNFASMYGYGGDLSNALNKLDNKGRTSIMREMDKIPIISTIIHINELPFKIIISLLDEHPEKIYRVKDQIEMLKYELNKEDIDPKMANVIKSDIKACEEALDALIDCTKGIDDPYFGKKVYNNILNSIPDLKHVAFGSVYNRYEEYDKIFKNGGN